MSRAIISNPDASKDVTIVTDSSGQHRLAVSLGANESKFYQENHICTDNTTTQLLGPNEVFIGAWQDCLNYHEVNVSVFADKDSATNGLEFQWSADGVVIGDTDNYSIYANTGTNYTPNPAFRYVRMKYTNGPIAQTKFSLMTILRRGMTGGSFHRIDSTLKDDSDGRLTLSVLKLRTAQNNYVSGAATNAGNFKISIQEFDPAVATNVNKLNIAPYLVDEFGVYSHMLSDNIFSGSPVVISTEHHEIHCGDSYLGCRVADLPNGGTDSILIIVPNETGTPQKLYHFLPNTTNESETIWYLYEAPVTSANGTTITQYNRNRNSLNTTGLQLFHTPTITNLGTLICIRHSGSGRGIGGEDRSEEFVLKNNTKYLLQAINQTAVNNHITWELNHYIHPGI